MMKIAVSMPGKLGDLLYCLPTVRHISKIFDTKVDFWTSRFCEPALPLLKAQSYIENAFVAEKYVPQHDQCGIQPFQLFPEKPYDKILHLGFREYPKCRLVDYFPKIYGLTMVDTTIKYDFDLKFSRSPSVVVCPGRNSLLKPYFAEIITELSKTNMVYQIGTENELLNIQHENVKNYPVDMLTSLSFLAGATLFVGTLSANLVLANGFPNLKKVVLVEPERHCPIHDIQSNNHYYIEPKNALKECLNV